MIPLKRNYLQTACYANLIIMLILAGWQIQRAQGKYDLISKKPQVEIQDSDLRNPQKARDKTPIVFHAPIDKTKYFIIEPAIYHHQVGVEILAVSFSSTLNKYVIINLGWGKSLENASKSIDRFAQSTTIRGILYQPKGKLIAHNMPQQSWPKKIAFLDLDIIQDHLKQPVFEYAIITRNTSLFENLTDPMILPLGIARHICYALQFAVFGMLGLYFSNQLTRNRHDPTREKTIK